MQKEYVKVVMRDGSWADGVGELYHDTLEKTLTYRNATGSRVFNFLEVAYYDRVSMESIGLDEDALKAFGI